MSNIWISAAVSSHVSSPALTELQKLQIAYVVANLQYGASAGVVEGQKLTSGYAISAFHYQDIPAESQALTSAYGISNLTNV